MHIVQHPEVQDFLFKHHSLDEHHWVLSGKEIAGVSPAAMAEQIASRRKAQEKLPTYFKTAGVVYPPWQNLEQSSSETTGDFKARLLRSATGENSLPVVDLTGGYGIDTFCFARLFSNVTYVEAQSWLRDIASLSHAALGLSNIEHVAMDSESYISSFNGRAAAVYIDPSRRTKGKKVVAFSDCSPNVVTLVPELFRKTDIILIKASPLLDIKAGISHLFNVYKIYVVSIKNECKEVLFLLKNGFEGEPEIIASNLETRQPDFVFDYAMESAATSTLSPPGSILYEPNASILKAGAFKCVGSQFGLKKIHANTHLYTSETVFENFPGRVFKIKGEISGSRSVRAWFPDMRASVLVRNFPTPADILKRQLKLGESDRNYVIAITSLKGKILLAAERLS
jgi:hypothetical protein